MQNIQRSTAKPASVEDILPWRDLYRQEMACQIIHDSLHSRQGWSLPYRLMFDGVAVGYGSIAVGGPDQLTTTLPPNGAIFRRAHADDAKRAFPHQVEPLGDWVLEAEGKIAATGGLLYHYNRPYGDIYMEVGEAFRRRGLGSYLVQELKRVCYEQGSVPAARCNPANIPSRKALQTAGFAPCGHILIGTVCPTPAKP